MDLAVAREPLVGYRGFRLLPDGRLCSLYRWVPWEPGRVLVAQCLARAWPPTPRPGAHRAPRVGCGCGITALSGTRHDPWPAGAIGGVVALSGAVILRETIPPRPGHVVMLAERARLLALAQGDNQRAAQIASRYGVVLLSNLEEWA